jgi:hypothetical protein
MACLLGRIIHLNEYSRSEAGRHWQSGVIELPNDTIQDFVLFDHKEALLLGEQVQLTGSNKQGTFMANWSRTPRQKASSADIPAPKIYRKPRGDEIDGLPPIEWLMDKLGGDEVTRRLKAEFGCWSDMLKSSQARARFQELLNLWISELRDNPEKAAKVEVAIPDLF